jgi:hypothetical protein
VTQLSVLDVMHVTITIACNQHMSVLSVDLPHALNDTIVTDNHTLPYALPLQASAR